jgi:hypothetical protein
MVRDVATMFEDLRAMADRYAELHADRVQLEAELEHARQDADRQRADHTAELERVRDELVRARQDAGYGVKRPTASAPVSPTCRPMPTEREMAQLRTEREQARRPLWQRLLGLKR